jgi:hypothetical protein
MPDNPFEEFGRNIARHLADHPAEYPSAVVKLIDAMREYLRSDETLAAELLHEEAITREDYDRGMAENAPLHDWLKKFEAWDLDPSLHGIIKEKH